MQIPESPVKTKHDVIMNVNKIYPHKLEECKKVIDIKARDPDFQDKYFRPITLFRASKFEGYLNEKSKENIW